MGSMHHFISPTRLETGRPDKNRSDVWTAPMEQSEQGGSLGVKDAVHKMSQEGQIMEVPESAVGATPAAADFHEALKRVVKSCVVLKCVLSLQNAPGCLGILIHRFRRSQVVAVKEHRTSPLACSFL